MTIYFHETIFFYHEIEFLNWDQNVQKIPLYYWLFWEKKTTWSPINSNKNISWKQIAKRDRETMEWAH